MLEGENIVLDAIEPESIEWMRQQRNNPELRKYFREWKDISADQQNVWYREMGNNSNPRHVYFQIMENHVRKNGDKYNLNALIGCCGLLNVDFRIRRAEFSIFLDPKKMRNGYGSEAFKLLLGFGFKDMNLNCVCGEVYDNNEAIEFYKKIGFEETGIMKHTYFKDDGTYGNSHVISMLREDWLK